MGESSWPRDWTHISCLEGGLFIAKPTGKPEELQYDAAILLMGKYLKEKHHYVQKISVFPYSLQQYLQ